MRPIDSEIFQKLYVNYEQLSKTKDDVQWKDLHWLNTPGPIFVGTSDNCGTGQPVAPNNVIGDNSYFEAIFRQPKTIAEFEAISEAAEIDPYDGYAFTGVKYWRLPQIRRWWSYVNDIAAYIRKLLAKELSYGPGDPHLKNWDLRGEIRQLHLYGPLTAIPENYQNWLDYFEAGEMQHDIEDFAFFLETGNFGHSEDRMFRLDNIVQQKLNPLMIKQNRFFVEGY